MNTIEIKTNHLEQVFTRLKDELGGTLETAQKEYTLELDNALVCGGYPFCEEYSSDESYLFFVLCLWANEP